MIQYYLWTISANLTPEINKKYLYTPRYNKINCWYLQTLHHTLDSKKIYIQRWMPTNKHVPAIILRDLFEMVKWPFQGVVGDLQLEDETITAWITWYTWHSMTHAIMQQKLSYQDTVLSWHVSDVSFDSTVLFRIPKKPWFLLLQAEKLLKKPQSKKHTPWKINMTILQTNHEWMYLLSTSWRLSS